MISPPYALRGDTRDLSNRSQQVMHYSFSILIFNHIYEFTVLFNPSASDETLKINHVVTIVQSERLEEGVIITHFNHKLVLRGCLLHPCFFWGGGLIFSPFRFSLFFNLCVPNCFSLVIRLNANLVKSQHIPLVDQ